MMPKIAEEIFYLSNKDVEALPIRAMRDGLFGVKLEDAFQKLLEEYPEIIPGKQIRPGADDPPRFVLIKREAPIANWSLDHLLVDQYGVLTLVECKLLQNSESRREVVGQIIEYAANAAVAWGGGQLRDFAHTYWTSRGKNFEQVCQSTLGFDEDMEEFWSRVESNLDQGTLRLIIAGDEIRPEVRRMIEYLNEEMEHVEVLGLELKCYGADDERLVLVPTIIGQSLASVDRRKSAARQKHWTPAEVEEAFRNMQDKNVADAYLTILKWAQGSDCFVSSVGKYPGFGVRNASGGRIFGVHETDGAWGYFEATKFSSSEERIDYIDQLKHAGLLVESFDPEKEGQKKLDMTHENAAKQLVEILAQQQVSD